MTQMFSTQIMLINNRAPVAQDAQRLVWSARYHRWHLLTDWPTKRLSSECEYTHWMLCPIAPKLD